MGILVFTSSHSMVNRVIMNNNEKFLGRTDEQIYHKRSIEHVNVLSRIHNDDLVGPHHIFLLFFFFFSSFLKIYFSLARPCNMVPGLFQVGTC